MKFKNSLILLVILSSLISCKDTKEVNSVDPEYETLKADLKSNYDSVIQVGAPNIPNLIKALKDQDPNVRRMAVHVLGKIKIDSTTTVLALLEVALKDKDYDVKLSAKLVLRDFGSDVKNAAAAPILIDALKNSDEDVRETAADILDYIKINSTPAVIALLEVALNDKDEDVRTAAQNALVNIGQVAVKNIIKVFKDDKENNREMAAKILGWIGSNAWEAISDLEKLAKNDPDDNVRKAAEVSLTEIKKSLDPNKKVNGMPILIIAVREKNLAQVSSLISMGADINKPDLFERNAIFFALEHQDFELIEFLFKNGAKEIETLKHKSLFYRYLNKVLIEFDISRGSEKSLVLTQIEKMYQIFTKYEYNLAEDKDFEEIKEKLKNYPEINNILGI